MSATEEAPQQVVAAPTPVNAEASRIAKIIAASADNAPPAMAKYIKMVAPVAGQIAALLVKAAPYVGAAWTKLCELYDFLPTRVLVAIYGFALCFFGGYFAVSVAAIEAANMCGWDKCKKNLLELRADYQKGTKAWKEDDTKDDDGDGVADVDQLTSQGLAQRKALLMLRTIDPKKCTAAIEGMWTSWMGVLTTLKFQFAKTVALGNSIGNSLLKPAEMLLARPLALAMAEDYHKWIPIIINYLVKTIAITIAWYIQQIISTVQSAIKGGLIFSRATLKFLNERGFTDIKDEETMMDEYVGWGMAGLGMYFQFSMGFELGFPFNIVFLPLRIIEWMLRWQVSEAVIGATV